jgi:hypothetical protein
MTAHIAHISHIYRHINASKSASQLEYQVSSNPGWDTHSRGELHSRRPRQLRHLQLLPEDLLQP